MMLKRIRGITIVFILMVYEIWSGINSCTEVSFIYVTFKEGISIDISNNSNINKSSNRTKVNI